MQDKAIKGVDVEISVVLGKAIMPIHQLLKMGRGAVIELDTNVDDDATVLANNKPIAYGEIVVVDDNIGISITDKISPNQQDVWSSKIISKLLREICHLGLPAPRTNDISLPHSAVVAELVDAQRWGRCPVTLVEVRVFSTAPTKSSQGNLEGFFVS